MNRGRNGAWNGTGAPLLLLLSACAEPAALGPPPAQSTARPSPTLAPSVVASAAPSVDAGPVAVAQEAPSASEPPFVGAARLGDWQTTADLIDALPEPARSAPLTRYVRARAALSLGDAARARELLTGLATLLPALSDDVARYQAEAALAAGAPGEAAAYFEARGKAPDLARAARARLLEGDTKAAGVLVARAVSLAERSRDDDALRAARAVRAELYDREGKAALALAERIGLAVSFPASAEGIAAKSALDALGHALTPKQELARAEALTDAGDGVGAVALLDRLPRGAGLDRGAVAEARARALYRARAYADAAKAYRDAAALVPARALAHRYDGARALARAGSELEALAVFTTLGKGRTELAARASFQAARLALQLGKFAEARAAYARYLTRFPKGDSRADATYEGALAALSAGDAAAARKSFGEQAAKASRDDAARLRQLEGLAALRAGDREGALALWTELARTAPLTWAGGLARMRLREAGAPLPPLLPPGSPSAAEPLAVELPPVVRELVAAGLDRDAERYLAALEPDVTAPHVGREGEALCGAYGSLAHATRRYRIGVREVSYGLLMTAPGPAEVWAWDCLYPRPYEPRVLALEATHGLPKGLVFAIMRQESAFDPGAESAVGARGLMQLMPYTAERVAAELGTRVTEAELERPAKNLELGARYLARLLGEMGGSLPLAVASYNAGPQAVSRWVSAGVELDADLFTARIPYAETRKYVARVMTNLARYQWLTGGEGAVLDAPVTVPLVAAPADAY